MKLKLALAYYLPRSAKKKESKIEVDITGIRDQIEKRNILRKGRAGSRRRFNNSRVLLVVCHRQSVSLLQLHGQADYYVAPVAKIAKKIAGAV